jgi:hypothetical protein
MAVRSRFSLSNTYRYVVALYVYEIHGFLVRIGSLGHASLYLLSNTAICIPQGPQGQWPVFQLLRRAHILRKLGLRSGKKNCGV